MNPSAHLVDTTMYWSPTGGGVRRYLRAKRAWLGRQPGWTHSLVVPGAADSPARAGGLVQFAAPRLPASGGYRLAWQRGRIAALLAGLRPDLIEAGDPFRVAWAALDAGQRLGVPVAAFCHGDLEAMAQLLGGRWAGAAMARAARRYLRHAYAGVDRVFVPSVALRTRLLAAGVERIVVQPLGVDTATFAPERRSDDWRSDHGFTSASRVLVYAGRYAPEKHLPLLAAAVERLGPPYTLVAIGAGPRPPVGRRVLCLPYTADERALATALASADVFVHAGDQETFGLAALEALACGTPLVVRRRAGLAELLDGDGALGLGVEQGSAAAFAEAIAALFEAPPAARREAARRRAVAQDWQQVLPALLGHYQALLQPSVKLSCAVSAPSPAPTSTSVG